MKQNDISKQVEVCLHTEDANSMKENPTSLPRSLSNQINANSFNKVVKDKKNKTTNVPSNCSTAIMMPLNGARPSSQQCDCLEKASNINASGHDKKNVMKHGSSNTSTMLNNGNSCEMYDIIFIGRLKCL